MFDAVLTGGNAPKQKIGQGVIFTILAHVVLVGIGAKVLITKHTPPPKQADVKFVAAAMAAPPPPPPPPPPPAGGSKPKVEKKPVPVKKPDTLVESKEKDEKKDEPKVDDKKNDEGAGQAGGVEGGVDGGVVGGVVGGVIGGQLGSPTPVPSTPPPTTMTYDSGTMTPPVMQSGASSPTYSREAREAKVEGKVIARCTITEDGRLVDCRIIKSLPFLDEVVLATLAARKYSPVMYQGRAQRVYYTFPFAFKLD
jgi:protein TonB